MKIAVNILGTSKNVDRLRVLTAGAIRSSQHEVVMNFVAEGDRPEFLPREWNWIRSDHVSPTNRHVHAMISGIASSAYDFNVFCDDDVIIDIDAMVSKFAKNQEPCLWTTWPGGNLAQQYQDDVRNNAGKFLNGKSTSSISVGFCSAVVNRRMMQMALEQDALPVLMRISDAISKRGFFPDLQLSILAWMIGVRNITGNLNGGTCWPCFLASSVLCKTGSMWHVHATGESPLVPSETLIKCLSKSPYVSADDLTTDLYPSLTKGIKAKDYIGRTMDIGYFWRPWRSRCNNIEVGGPYFSNRVIMNSDGTVSQQGGEGEFRTWEPCEFGFMLKGRTQEGWTFKWKHTLGVVGIPPLDIINENGMLMIGM